MNSACADPGQVARLEERTARVKRQRARHEEGVLKARGFAGKALAHCDAAPNGEPSRKKNQQQEDQAREGVSGEWQRAVSVTRSCDSAGPLIATVIVVAGPIVRINLIDRANARRVVVFVARGGQLRARVIRADERKSAREHEREGPNDECVPAGLRECQRFESSKSPVGFPLPICAGTIPTGRTQYVSSAN
jgi:hypothetical protein